MDHAESRRETRCHGTRGSKEPRDGQNNKTTRQQDNKTDPHHVEHVNKDNGFMGSFELQRGIYTAYIAPACVKSSLGSKHQNAMHCCNQTP